jgi:hypothetical protein
MTQLNSEQFDRLERAVARKQRIVVHRRGTEYVVVPLGLANRNGRDVIDTRNPTTGDLLSLFIDEIEAIEVVG